MLNSYTVNTLEYNLQLCNGCRTCIEVCPHGVFTDNRGKVKITNIQACMECGACLQNCAQMAIGVNSGVGCATAMIWSALRGRKEVSCGCG